MSKDKELEIVQKMEASKAEAEKVEAAEAEAAEATEAQIKLDLLEQSELLEWIQASKPELILQFRIDRMIRSMLPQVKELLGDYSASILIDTKSDEVSIKIRKLANPDSQSQSQASSFDWKAWASKLVDLGKLPESAAKNKTQFRRALAARFDGLAEADLKDDQVLLAKARELINS